MSIILGDANNDLNSPYNKAIMTVPGTNTQKITINPECLDMILIERIFDTKYGIYGCQAMGYSETTKEVAIVRIDHLRNILSLLTKRNITTLPLIDDVDLKNVFGDDVEKDSQKILIRFRNKEIEKISFEHIDTMFQMKFILEELLHSMDGQEADLRNKQLVQQFMLGLRASMGQPQETQGGIILPH